MTDLVQVPDPDGHVVHGAANVGVPEPAFLVDAYRRMVLARAIDELAVTLQRQGALALYASFRGQEAVQVAAAMALRDVDWIFPTYREGAMLLARGLPPVEVLEMFRGTSLCGYDPTRTRVAPMSIPIATQALHAVGLAMAAALDGAPLVALACFGDGATSEGDLHEALNFAAVYGAPCVFLCQNNQYAISTSVHRQARAPFVERARGYGMPGVRCDGNDLAATYAVVTDAVDRARGGGGPTLVEALTYRLGAHTTADDPSRYRDSAEVEARAADDPLARLQSHLELIGAWDAQLEERVRSEAEALAQRVRSQVHELRAPSPLTLFDHVYATPGHLLAQRAELSNQLRF